MLLCLHNFAPDLFKSYFIKSSYEYSTRLNGLDILIPKVCTESAKKGTFYTGAQAFNNLTPYLKEVDSVIFKTQLNDLFFRAVVNRLEMFKSLNLGSYMIRSFYSSTLYIVFTFF